LSSNLSLRQSQRHARAERILDVAAQLLQRWGYKRVTIEDIAIQAGIGKGTIYLHWPTREALFNAVLQRELLAAIDGYLNTLRDRPEELLLHRLVQYFWLMASQRPIIRAIFTQDLDTLGLLVQAGDKALLAQQYQAFEQYVELLKGARLLRANLTAIEVMYVYRAVTTGFFLAETLIPDQHQPDFKRKADLLAATFQRAFDIPEPAPRAAVASIAPRIIALLQKIMEAKRATIHPKT
jgi:AcrR family transcriptional regulator